jgi:LmbE family N-acetylglucosaminyl deacetylase
VAPHPDDEALGCGGTVALITQAGAEVAVCVMGRGDGGVDGVTTAEGRQDESRRACEILGTEAPSFADLPSPAIREDPASAGSRLAACVEGRVFDTLLVPSPLERHDTHRACLLAALLSGAAAADAEWWGWGVWDALPAIDDVHEVDITAARAAKLRAVAAHKSQDGARPLAAGMASRDLAQAVYSRITGDEKRKAVERLWAMRGLGQAVASEADAAAAGQALKRWLVGCQEQWVGELWA